MANLHDLAQLIVDAQTAKDEFPQGDYLGLLDLAAERARDVLGGHVLVVTNNEIDVELHGPFATVKEAQDYAERYRAALGLPIQATNANNEAWTERGWYFGIQTPTVMPQFQSDPPDTEDRIGAVISL